MLITWKYLWMGGVALNRLKILILTFHDWLKRRKLLLVENFYVCGILVYSFAELVQYMFTVPGVTVLLSNKISQDKLENFLNRGRGVELIRIQMQETFQRIHRH